MTRPFTIVALPLLRDFCMVKTKRSSYTGATRRLWLARHLLQSDLLVSLTSNGQELSVDISARNRLISDTHLHRSGKQAKGKIHRLWPLARSKLAESAEWSRSLRAENRAVVLVCRHGSMTASTSCNPYFTSAQSSALQHHIWLHTAPPGDLYQLSSAT